MVGGWTLLYVAVYPWGDLAAGLGLVAAAAMGAWLGPRRGSTAVAGWALAGLLAGGTTAALAVALAQIATALVLGQLRDLRFDVADQASLARAPGADQLLRYARALLRPDRAELCELRDRPTELGVQALAGGRQLLGVVALDDRVLEMALERARPFDLDERALFQLLLDRVSCQRSSNQVADAAVPELAA